MTLLSGIRNLIGRITGPVGAEMPGQRPGSDPGHGAGHDGEHGRGRGTDGGRTVDDLPEDVELAAAAQFESKPAPAGPPLRIVQDNGEHAPQMQDIVEAIGSRLGAHGQETLHLVREVQGEVRSHAAESQRAVAEISRQCSQLVELAEAHRDQAGTGAKAAGAAVESAIGSAVESAIERIVSSVQQVEQRLGAQASQSLDRIEALGTGLQAIPQVAGAVAEVKQQCERLTALLAEQADDGRKRADALAAAVDGAARQVIEGAQRDQTALETVRRQLDTATAAIRETSTRWDSVVSSMRTVGEQTGRLGQSLGEILRSVEARDANLTRLLEKNRRSLLLVAWACSLGALAALAIGVAGVFLATQ